MIRWEQGIVTGHRAGWDGVQRVLVSRAPGRDSGMGPDAVPMPADALESIPALSYLELAGPLTVGDRVLLNTNALRRGLGTGGEALVVARIEADGPSAEEVGHLVKARYTPLQTMVGALEDPESPHHELLARVDSVPGNPVITADLHSAIPAILAGLRLHRPDARVVLVHTDAAALPAAFSRSVAQLRDAGWLHASISAGQAFGGDAEAVSIHSGIIAAHAVMGADAVIAAQGPGNLGSGTPWGFSGLQVAETIHAAAAVGADPICVLRVSEADTRDRHLGLSHHTATTLGRAAFAPAAIAVPDGPHSTVDALISEQLESLVESAAARGIRHTVHAVSTAGIDDVLAASPVHLSTMGRSLSEDRAAFVYAALAGVLAAQGLRG